MVSRKTLIFTITLSHFLFSNITAQAADDTPALDKLLQDMKPTMQAPVKDAKKTAAEKSILLRDALAAAYIHNPQLLAARAQLRAIDENYAQAVSGYRPSVNGAASYISSRNDDGTNTNSGDPKNLSIEISQPIYRGGTTTAEVLASENLIKAERANLSNTEQFVFLDVVTAYMDVLSTQEILHLTINNVKVLTEQLEAARARFKLGDITKTDVSQAEARLANALASRVSAEGDLKKSRAEFERTTSLSPDHLARPSLSVPVPTSLEAALEEADTRNPTLLYARYNRNAAEASTRAVVGGLLPQIDLEGSVGRTYDTLGGDSREDSGSIGLRATIPFYSGGGATYSRVRQSRQIETQRRQEISDAERNVRQGVIDAWEELTSTEAEKRARQVQIDAAKTALNGVKLETDYGSRTTLDLLDAEQEYLDAQVAYVIADRDSIVATYTLISATGQLTARDIALNVPAYNPDKNFQNVKSALFGGSITAEE